MKTLYSAVYNDGFPFQTLLTDPKNVAQATHPADMLEFDSALVVWGGADISPDLYGHPTSRRCAPYASRRDQIEWELMAEAIEMEIPIIGVCRGAQMLCAAAGGFLIQDMNNHAGYGHDVLTHDGHKLGVNSIHHQMMVPFGVPHEMVAWAATNIGEPYIYRDDKLFKPEEYGYTEKNPWREPEFVYFPDINGYAIQWHPEMMRENSPATVYVLDYIKKKEAARTNRVWAIGKKVETVS